MLSTNCSSISSLDCLSFGKETFSVHGRPQDVFLILGRICWELKSRITIFIQFHHILELILDNRPGYLNLYTYGTPACYFLLAQVYNIRLNLFSPYNLTLLALTHLRYMKMFTKNVGSFEQFSTFYVKRNENKKTPTTEIS